jgi:hypothetical protein
MVDANNLPANDQYVVVMEQGGKKTVTNNAAFGADPIWNEASLFKIEDPKQNLKVTI